MGYIHCCGGLRKSKSYAVTPEENYLFAQVDYLQECPICGHTVTQLTRIDYKNEVSTYRKVNEKARKLFEKMKTLILFEKNAETIGYIPSSKYGFYYNEFGVKKKCYSNLSSLKMGTFESKNLPKSGQLEVIRRKNV